MTLRHPALGTTLFGIGLAVFTGGSLVVIGTGWQAIQLAITWLILAALFVAAEVRWFLRLEQMRWKRLGISVAIAVPVLVLFHPFILGLPGRIGEALFLAQVNKGMNESQLFALMTRTGGDGPGFGKRWPGVGYMTVGTICIAAGDVIYVALDSKGHPSSWYVDQWHDQC